jgi:hypothetical protein
MTQNGNTHGLDRTVELDLRERFPELPMTLFQFLKTRVAKHFNSGSDPN